MTKRYEKPLSPEELAALPDEAIDTSDIPELDESFFAKAILREPNQKPVVSLRVDEDVIAFFKSDNPKGYTRRMAAVLAAYAEHHKNAG